MKLREIATMVGSLGTSPVEADPELEITGVRGLAEAGSGDASFIKDKRHLSEALQSGASLLFVAELQPELAMVQMKVANPHLAFSMLLGALNPLEHGPVGVSPLAYVGEGATIAEGATVMPQAHIAPGASIGTKTVIYPGVYVGRGVSVGEDCVLWPGVVLRDKVRLGNRVILHPGAVIGGDGFGYISGAEGHFKVPQVGGVFIDDDVEIGANSTVDRATTGMTVIGRGTKIDNLVQVGHNVQMGRACIVVAGTGIGGSSRIGDGVIIGGQVAIKDNVNIASGTMLAARTGVGSDLEKGIYGGAPAFNHKKWLKTTRIVEQLPELLQRVRDLEQALIMPQKGHDKA